ncbi:MAG: hypothetical protein ACXAD7_01180 [Candidatus Kariarchaeaceae archaeon]
MNGIDEKEYVEYVTDIVKETLNYNPTYYDFKETKPKHTVNTSAGLVRELVNLGQNSCEIFQFQLEKDNRKVNDPESN